MTAAPKPLVSPCVQSCVIDPKSRLCVGCFRTVEEVVRWGGYSDDKRREIMATLKARAPRISSEWSLSGGIKT